MTVLSDYRAKHPQYDHVPDAELAAALHKKYYANMPDDEFAAKVGLKVKVDPETMQPAMSLTDRVADVGQSLATGVRGGIEAGIGAFGDVADINERGVGAGVDWAAQKLGASPETAGTIGNAVGDVAGAVTRFASPAGFGAPTTNQIQGITDPVIGEHYKPKTVAGEYAKTAGEFLPAATLGPGNAVRRVATQAIIPAITSETAGQLTKGTALEAPARVLGAIAGPAALSGARRVLTPFPASAERLAQADILANEGVDLTAGQRTGSEKLRYMESELGGTAAQRFNERQGKQFTRATLKRAGIDADLATPEVMDQAFERIGGQFDGLAARNELVPDAQFAADLTADLKGYNSLKGHDQRAPIIENTVTDIVKDIVGTGKMTGERYQALRSDLDKQARATIASDPTLSESLRDLRTTLDDAMERSLAANNPHDAGLWRKARREYRNILVIEKAATGAGENAAMGIISPAALKNATVQVQRRRAYARGQGDFAELSRAGEATMKPLPNSGTSARMAARGIGATLGAAIGGTVPGVGHVLGGVAGIVAPGMVGRAVLSGPGRAVLGNQLAVGAGANFGRNAFVSGLMGSRNSPGNGSSDQPGPLRITVRRHNTLAGDTTDNVNRLGN